MASLRTWWDRLLGRETYEEPTAHAPDLRDHPHVSKPASETPGSLTVTDTPPPAGFDPYGNDAGFSKPHSWERIDHD